MPYRAWRAAPERGLYSTHGCRRCLPPPIPVDLWRATAIFSDVTENSANSGHIPRIQTHTSAAPLCDQRTSSRDQADVLTLETARRERLLRGEFESVSSWEKTDDVSSGCTESSHGQGATEAGDGHVRQMEAVQNVLRALRRTNQRESARFRRNQRHQATPCARMKPHSRRRRHTPVCVRQSALSSSTSSSFSVVRCDRQSLHGLSRSSTRGRAEPSLLSPQKSVSLCAGAANQVWRAASPSPHGKPKMQCTRCSPTRVRASWDDAVTLDFC